MRLWAILFAAFIVSIIVLADPLRLGFLGAVHEFPFGDKIAHSVLFGILSLLVNLAVVEAGPAAGMGRGVVVCSLIPAIPIGLEELSQPWFPARTSSWYDLAGSDLRVGAFVWLAAQIESRQPHAK